MDQLPALIDAIIEEDSLLRQRLASCPSQFRDLRGPGGTLSFKETLGHIAFWDDFTVQFFASRLDRRSRNPQPPADFERRSAEALTAMRSLPFGEVLARYLEATGALIDFLRGNWRLLDERDRKNFWVPVKHRRHHRLTLFRELDSLQGAEHDRTLAAEA